jgi:hypothetical protein
MPCPYQRIADTIVFENEDGVQNFEFQPPVRVETCLENAIFVVGKESSIFMLVDGEFAVFCGAKLTRVSFGRPIDLLPSHQ